MPFIVSDYYMYAPFSAQLTIKDEIIIKIEHIAALEHINVSPRAIVAT